MEAARDLSKPFTSAAAAFLGLVGLVHLLRAFAGWTIVIEGWPVPASWSGAVAVPLLGLAAMVWREARH
ncbi:MAG: hypothetical protein GY719_03505 [bacterium]|nr:hypothetical protein [bacterium]